MDVFCPKCGAAVERGALYCTRCGAAIPGSGWPDYAPRQRVVDQTVYLIWAIVVTLFFFPLGIPAIIYACRINELQDRGDVEGARRAARTSKQFSVAAGCTGGALLFLFVILPFVLFFLALIGVVAVAV